jgi:hypothetical protein
VRGEPKERKGGAAKACGVQTKPGYFGQLVLASGPTCTPYVSPPLFVSSPAYLPGEAEQGTPGQVKLGPKTQDRPDFGLV